MTEDPDAVVDPDVTLPASRRVTRRTVLLAAAVTAAGITPVLLGERGSGNGVQPRGGSTAARRPTPDASRTPGPGGPSRSGGATPRPHTSASGAAESPHTVPSDATGPVPEPSPAVCGVSWDDVAVMSGRPVIIDQPVLLDRSVRVAGLDVRPGGQLLLSADHDVTIETTGNVVVRGLLKMAPDRKGVRHRLVFTGVDEQRYVGGGMDPVDSDVGLWVVDDGRLDLAGTPRTAWVRLAGSARAGDGSLQLAVKPTGWQVGDELAVTPSGPPGDGHHDAYDIVKIVSVSGTKVRVSPKLKHAHPALELAPGVTGTAEVLNLTRDVEIAGTPGGRAHVFIRSRRAQQLRFAALRHLAPRKGSGDGEDVLGRYGLHFHHAGDGARGSLIDGVVARDMGNHAFVAHLSHGVTFRACISHNTVNDAYWWDGAPDTRTPGPPSDDITYERCVASKVVAAPRTRGFRLAGFTLGAGERNAAIDCVAVGVQGNKDASGFGWPEGPTSSLWRFRNCEAHNNTRHGIFTWQNTNKPHIVSDFACWNNGGSGIAHGAYVNRYSYVRGLLIGNAESGLALHSLGDQRFIDLIIDGRGRAAYGIGVLKHTLTSDSRSVVRACLIMGHTTAAIGFGLTGAGEQAEAIDVVDCDLASPEFRLSDSIHPASQIRVQQRDGAFALYRRDQPGEPVPAWNASRRPTETFMTVPPRKPPRSKGPTSSGDLAGRVLPGRCRGR